MSHFKTFLIAFIAVGCIVGLTSAKPQLEEEAVKSAVREPKEKAEELDESMPFKPEDIDVDEGSTELDSNTNDVEETEEYDETEEPEEAEEPDTDVDEDSTEPNSSTTEIDPNTIAPPNSNGCGKNGHYNHESDCSLYYQCYDGLRYDFYCPDGLYFDVKNERCEWPDKVHCNHGF